MCCKTHFDTICVPVELCLWSWNHGDIVGDGCGETAVSNEKFKHCNEDVQLKWEPYWNRSNSQSRKW